MTKSPADRVTGRGSPEERLTRGRASLPTLDRLVLRDALLRFVVPVLPGLLVFLLLYRPLLDPWDVSWLFAPNPVTFDAAQSGMGWLYFAADEWRWPLGSNPDNGGNIANSLLFTDSLPAFAVLAKLTFAVVGIDGPTQIIGLSLLTCLMVQSSLGHALVRVMGGGRVTALLGACFVVLAPALLVRWNIASLFWQWIVLAALLLALSRVPWRARTALWAGLAFFATGISPYYALMVVTVGAVDSLVRGGLVGKWHQALVGVASAGIAFYVGLHTWGAFSIQTGSAAAAPEQLGLYSANVLSLLDSGGLSYFVRDLPGGSGEGFNYLGLGVLVLLLMAATAWFQRGGRLRRPDGGWVAAARARPAVPVLMISVAVLAVTSTLPKVSVGGASAVLPLPPPAMEVLAIFRANGRFHWPLMYLLVVVAVLAASAVVRRGVWVVGLALALQLVDLQGAFRNVSKDVGTAAEAQVQYQEILRPILSDPEVEALEVVPAFPYPPDIPWREIGLAAYEADLPLTTVGYLNRYDTAALIEIRDAGLADVQAGRLRSDTVYIVSREVYDGYLAARPGTQVLTELDGWVFLRSTSGP